MFQKKKGVEFEELLEASWEEETEERMTFKDVAIRVADQSTLSTKIFGGGQRVRDREIIYIKIHR